MIPSAFLSIYVGTYTRTTSRGIYFLQLDPQNGILSVPTLAAETPDPTYLALSPDRQTLVAVCATRIMSVSYRLNEEEPGELKALQGPQTPIGPAPCHISYDRTGKVLLLANYHTAIVAAALVNPDGTSAKPNTVIHTGHGANPERQKTAHVHSAFVSPDNRHVAVCDLGQDKIFNYRLDLKTAELSPGHPPFVQLAPASGPRHFVYSNFGKTGYVVNELSNTVMAFTIDVWANAMTQIQSISTLPLGYTEKNTAGAIRIHPNGKFLYASNRGHDSIAIYRIDPDTTKLSLVQIMPCGGNGPRDFELSPDGKWLVCANQDSNTLCTFGVDPDDGRMARVPGSQEIPMPVSVLFV